MSTRWLLTVKADCDLKALASELASHGVSMLAAKRPLPMGDTELAITVRTDSSTLPPEVTSIPGVVQAYPATKLGR